MDADNVACALRKMIRMLIHKAHSKTSGKKLAAKPHIHRLVGLIDSFKTRQTNLEAEPQSPERTIARSCSPLGLQRAVVATSPKGLSENQIQRARIFAGSPQARQKSNKCDAEADDEIAKLYGISSRRKAFTMHVDEANDDVLSVASTKSYEAGFVCSCFCLKLFSQTKPILKPCTLGKHQKHLATFAARMRNVRSLLHQLLPSSSATNATGITVEPPW